MHNRNGNASSATRVRPTLAGDVLSDTVLLLYGGSQVRLHQVHSTHLSLLPTAAQQDITCELCWAVSCHLLPPLSRLTTVQATLALPRLWQLSEEFRKLSSVSVQHMPSLPDGRAPSTGPEVWSLMHQICTLAGDPECDCSRGGTWHQQPLPAHVEHVAHSFAGVDGDGVMETGLAVERWGKVRALGMGLAYKWPDGLLPASRHALPHPTPGPSSFTPPDRLTPQTAPVRMVATQQRSDSPHQDQAGVGHDSSQQQPRHSPSQGWPLLPQLQLVTRNHPHSHPNGQSQQHSVAHPAPSHPLYQAVPSCPRHGLDEWQGAGDVACVHASPPPSIHDQPHALPVFGSGTGHRSGEFLPRRASELRPHDTLASGREIHLGDESDDMPSQRGGPNNYGGETLQDAIKKRKKAHAATTRSSPRAPPADVERRWERLGVHAERRGGIHDGTAPSGAPARHQAASSHPSLGSAVCRERTVTHLLHTSWTPSASTATPQGAPTHWKPLGTFWSDSWLALADPADAVACAAVGYEMELVRMLEVKQMRTGQGTEVIQHLHDSRKGVPELVMRSLKMTALGFLERKQPYAEQALFKVRARVEDGAWCVELHPEYKETIRTVCRGHPKLRTQQHGSDSAAARPRQEMVR